MSFLIAFITTLASLFVLKRVALKMDFVDKPDARKQHQGHIPPIGGLGIVSVFLVLSFFFVGAASMNIYLVSALTLLLVTGIVDDSRHVSAKIKFLIHFISAILIVIGGANLKTMGLLFSSEPSSFGWFAPIFSVCCVVYLINAMNMIDGLDGLCGGVTLVIICALMCALSMAGQVIPVQMWLLCGGLVAFLCFNLRSPLRSKAAIFLGDAGSMVLGLVVAWYAITLSQPPYMAYEPIAVAWVLALPIWDAFGLFSARIREGRHPFDADRRHFHHHFIEAGFSVGQSTALILCYSAVLAVIGIGLPKLGVPVWVLTYLWIAFWILHAQLSYKPQKFISFLKRTRARLYG